VWKFWWTIFLGFTHSKKNKIASMDGWTALIAAQQGLRTDTIEQYYKLNAMNQCAMAFGLQPVNGVTLSSDVLGQLVFSALGRSVAGGKRSRDAQLRHEEQIVDIVDRGTHTLQKYGPILRDTKLSTGEKIEKGFDNLVEEKGGVGGAILAGVSALGLAGATAQKAWANYNGVLLTAIVDIFREDEDANEFKPEKNNESVKQKIRELLAAYKEIKKDKDTAIKYLKGNILIPADELTNLINSQTYDTIPEQIRNKYGDLAPNGTQFPLYRALFLWINTTVCAFKQFMKEPCEVKQAEGEVKQDLARLQPEIQRLLTYLHKSKISVQKSAVIGSTPQDTYTDLGVCQKYAEIFRKDSIATRELLQEMLKTAVVCGSAKAQ
jgi:hypothetical protein